MFRKSGNTVDRMAARLGRLNERAENAAVRGRVGKSMRLGAEAEETRLYLEDLTGMPWEDWGAPRQD